MMGIVAQVRNLKYYNRLGSANAMPEMASTDVMTPDAVRPNKQSSGGINGVSKHLFGCLV